MKCQCHSLVAVIAICSLFAGFVTADEFDDDMAVRDKEAARVEAEIEAWKANRTSKPDTPCQTAWKSNSANHSCTSSTILDEPNDQCRFVSIACANTSASPTDDWNESENQKGEYSATYVKTSKVYEDFTAPLSEVGKYNNCDGELTINACNK
ncbi:hypothetical protein [Pseudomonas sp. B33.4]|uniref:hypothetical protein n=1 Tax=Pseudomonas sp. B33.4 TaxID=3104265 RepID=UPI002ADEF1C8|nr:hypothetical protein [Pseudomonas sp. B33.4]